MVQDGFRPFSNASKFPMYCALFVCAEIFPKFSAKKYAVPRSSGRVQCVSHTHNVCGTTINGIARVLGACLKLQHEWMLQRWDICVGYLHKLSVYPRHVARDTMLRGNVIQHVWFRAVFFVHHLRRTSWTIPRTRHNVQVLSKTKSR